MIILNFLYEFLWGKIVILTASNIYNKRKKIFNVVVNASLVRSFRFSLLDVAPRLFFYSFFFLFFFGGGGWFISVEKLERNKVSMSCHFIPLAGGSEVNT